MLANRRLGTFRSVVLCGILVSFAACGPRTFDATSEGARLLQLDADWADAAAAGKDVDKIVSYWADDAILMFPGQPVLKGKSALRAYVAESLKTPGFKIRWKSENPTFSPDGKLAYMAGTDEVTMPGPNGVLMTLHYRSVTIWRLDSDGRWRCVVDIASEAPPPARTAT